MKKMLLIASATALMLLFMSPADSQGQVPPKPTKTWAYSAVIHIVTSCPNLPGLPPGPWNLAAVDVSKLKPYRGLVMKGEPLTNGPKKMPMKKEK